MAADEIRGSFSLLGAIHNLHLKTTSIFITKIVIIFILNKSNMDTFYKYIPNFIKRSLDVGTSLLTVNHDKKLLENVRNFEYWNTISLSLVIYSKCILNLCQPFVQ